MALELFDLTGFASGEQTMSLQPEPIGPIPEQTVQIARAAFPKGNTYIHLRDVLGVFYDDATFAPLFAPQGRPAETPWRLALVTIMQFREGLSDRQAAEAVRARIDWKYALGLELDDPGFDYSVLCGFRSRLIEGSAELSLLSALLDACQAKGYLKARGRQRTDSTHVLAALRLLSRLENVAETLRCALDAVAQAAPEWLREHALPEWFERYSRRIEEYRLPKGQEARQEFAQNVGLDGMSLLTALYAPDSPPLLRELSAVEHLRRSWVQQYFVKEGQLCLRDPKDQPPVSQQSRSPYETEARYGAKGTREWIGYKVHLTESCDEDSPRLLTNVQTTIATVPDIEQVEMIHRGLAQAGLLPSQHLVDGGYVGAAELVKSQAEHGIDLSGPVCSDHGWQARAGEGFDASHFVVDWQRQVVRCPQGYQSIQWCPIQTWRGNAKIHVAFSKVDCRACVVRESCTRAKDRPRSVSLHAQAEHKALEEARERQGTDEFWALYCKRAGIEGTISQGVRAFDLRQARYRGLAKTNLQHMATAAAINLGRLDDWLNRVPSAKTRTSRFAALASLN
jgi:transposase